MELLIGVEAGRLQREKQMFYVRKRSISNEESGSVLARGKGPPVVLRCE